jgi:hypothetical protein
MTISVLEIEVHAQGCDPHIVVMARIHQDTWSDQPLISCETIDRYRAYPANLVVFNQLDHSCHAGACMNSKRAAQRLIVCYYLNATGTSYVVSEMLDKFACLHLETVDVGPDLDEAGLPDVDDAIFVFWELTAESHQVLVCLLLDASDAHF